MLRFSFLIVFLYLLSVSAPVKAQIAGDSTAVPGDSLAIKDSVLPVRDSLSLPPVSTAISKKPYILDFVWRVVDSVPIWQQVLSSHPYFNFRSPAVPFKSNIKTFQGKETLFYTLIALLMLFALLRTAFAKYFNDLFRVFFRTTLKQRQIKEQLIQTPLPSLMFNIFFVASAGLYANFMLFYFNFTPVDGFWILYLYCCAGLAVIYLVKYLGLKVCGWLFSMTQAADAYIFIVFIINKMIGIALLPFLVLIAFTSEPLYSIAVVLSWCCIAGLFLYRFILGYAAIHKEVRFNLFHFFLYLCAFEIAPLLLIYKLLLFFL